MPQLPGYNFGNALIDFSPVANALSDIQKQRNFTQQMGMDQQRLDMSKEQFGLEKQRFAQQSKDAAFEHEQKLAQRYAGISQMIDQEPDPTKQAAMTQRMIASHPEFANQLQAYGVDPSDHVSVRKLVQAEARGYMNPQDVEMRNLQMQNIRQNMQKTQAEIGVLNQKAAAGPGALDANQRVGAEHNLRKEYSQLAKPYFDVRDAYARVEQSAKAPSAAGDLALIFNYMKMLDPGSVVREGEFATAQNAAGLPDQIRNMYNRILNGERLNEGQRGDFVGQARGLMDVQEKQYKAIQDQYGGIAQRTGVDPRNVMVDFSQPPAQPSLSFPLNVPVPKGTYKWDPNSGDIR